MAKLVTTTYAQALFQLAVEEGKVDELFSQVEALIAILDENPDLARIMRHPGVDKNEKIEVINNIFSGNVSPEVCGLLNQVVVNNRYEEIDGILASFINMVKEYKKIGIAYVQTPADLSDAQKKRIEQKLLDTTGYVKMEMNYIGDRVVDSSISTKLNELAKDLRRIQLNTI